MILFADCSALVALSICNRLELLEQIFGQVVVPEAVYDEATQPNKKQASQLKIYLKDKVRKVDMQNYVFLDGFADAGETEAMVLYKQISADKLLIDDIADMVNYSGINSRASRLQDSSNDNASPGFY